MYWPLLINGLLLELFNRCTNKEKCLGEKLEKEEKREKYEQIKPKCIHISGRLPSMFHLHQFLNNFR